MPRRGCRPRPSRPARKSGVAGIARTGRKLKDSARQPRLLVVCGQHISIGDHVLQTLPMDCRAARALLLALTAIAVAAGVAGAWGQAWPPPAAAPETPAPAPPDGATRPQRHRPRRRRPRRPRHGASGRPRAAGDDDRARPRPGGRHARRRDPAREPVRRPRLSAAVGMGGKLRCGRIRDHGVARDPDVRQRARDRGRRRTVSISAPGATEAAGRHGNQNPIDRLAVDAFGVIRPGAWFRPDDSSYQLRVLRGLAAELGLGFERDGRSAVSGTRFVVHVGRARRLSAHAGARADGAAAAPRRPARHRPLHAEALRLHGGGRDQRGRQRGRALRCARRRLLMAGARAVRRWSDRCWRSRRCPRSPARRRSTSVPPARRSRRRSSRSSSCRRRSSGRGRARSRGCSAWRGTACSRSPEAAP